MRRPLGLDYGADAAVLGLGAGGGGRRGRPVVVWAMVRAVPMRQEGAVGVPMPMLVVLVRMRVRGWVVVVMVVVGRRVLVAVGAMVWVWRGHCALSMVRGLRGHVALGWDLPPLATKQGP